MIIHLNTMQELIQILLCLGIYEEGSIHFNESHIGFNRMVSDKTSPTRKIIKISLEETDSLKNATYSISILIPFDTSKYGNISTVIEHTIEELQQNGDITSRWTCISKKPSQTKLLYNDSFSYVDPSIFERRLQKSIMDGDTIALKVLETLIWAC